jgi:hypothetical protein
VSWLFGRTRNARRSKQPPLPEKEIPRDDERYGPAPPPPRTAHAPGVSVYTFHAIPSQHLLRLSEGSGGFFLEGEEGRNRSSALLVLWAASEPKASAAADAAAAQGGGGAGAPPPPSPGDVLIWDDTARIAFAPAAPSLSIPLEELSRTSPGPGHNSNRDHSLPLPLKEISRTSPKAHRHIRRDDLGGRGVPGITGLRTLTQLPEEHLAVLRLGPPPGARWVFQGLRAVAVFSGRFTAFDGDDVKEIRAGSLARVAELSATLYLEAGTDAALAVALAAPGFVAALG